MCNDVFVILNVKNIGEVRSLIVDKAGINNYYNEKYLMCAGKYDKSGWTIVFKAKNYEEAEYIIEHTPLNFKKEIRVKNNQETISEEQQLDISITKKFSYLDQKNKAATEAATLNKVS